MPQLRGCGVRADRSELMHCSISPAAAGPAPPQPPEPAARPAVNHCSRGAGAPGLPSTALPGSTPGWGNGSPVLCSSSGSRSRPGSSQLSLLQGPWEQHCHVRDLFLLSDMCVHMDTHGPEHPRGVWHPVSSSPLFRGCEEHLNLPVAPWAHCGATGE